MDTTSVVSPLESGDVKKLEASNDDIPVQVLKLLSASKAPLQAKEIAERLSRSMGRVIDKSAINQLLYSELNAKVSRDEEFQWSLKSVGSKRMAPKSVDSQSTSKAGFGLNFPVAEYYRDHIKDAVTLSRGGQWWSAALLIKDPRNNQLFVNLYTWELVGGDWKKRKSFAIRSKKVSDQLRDVLSTLGDRLP